MYSKNKYKTRKPYVKKNAVQKIARAEAKKVMERDLEEKRLLQYSSPGAGSHGYVQFGASVALGAVQQSCTFGALQGINDEEYIGDKIKPTGLKIHWTVLASTGDAYNNFRLIVVQVKGGGTPSVDNILESTGNMLTPMSPWDNSYRDTYKVLYNHIDVVHQISSGSAPMSANCTKRGVIYIPGKKFSQVHFTNTGLGNVSSNQIAFFAISDSTAANHPTIGYWVELTYTDA